MQQLGILLIVEKDAEMLVGSARRSSSGAAWGSTQTVKESRQGHRALLIGHVLECGLWQRRVGSWWSPFRVAKLGESVGRAGCKGLSGEGAGGSGELTEVDEGRCASGPGSVAGCVTASGVRCKCDSGGRLVQKSNPSAGVEAIATSVELFGRDAGFARRAKEQHARREAEKLPTA